MEKTNKQTKNTKNEKQTKDKQTNNLCFLGCFKKKTNGGGPKTNNKKTI